MEHCLFYSPRLTKGIGQIIVRIGIIRPQFQSLAVLRDRLVDLALLAKSFADVVVALRVIKWQFEGLFVMTDGLVDFTILKKSVAQIAVRVGISGPFFECLFKMHNRFDRSALLEQSAAKTILRVRIIGRYHDGRLELSHGLVDPTLPQKRVAEIAVPFPIRRLYLKHLLEMYDRLIQVAFII